jgi:GAF domain-containing protein
MSAARRVGAVAALAWAAAVVAGGYAGTGRPAWWAVPALAAAVATTELAVVHVPFRKQRCTFSLTEGVIAAAYVAAPGGWVALAVGVGVLAAQCLRRQSWLKVAFNGGQFALASALGALVAGRAGGGVPAACAGLATFLVANTALVAVPISVMTGQPLLGVLRDSVSLSTLQETATSSIGVLAGWLGVHAPAGLLGLAAPVGLLLVSYDETTSRATEARLFAELAQRRERSLDASAEVALVAAGRLLGDVAISLVAVGPTGPVRYDLGEDGVARCRVEPAAFDAPEVLAALATGVSAGERGARPYVAAVADADEDGRPVAVLVASRAAGQPAFGRHDIALARLLVQHCGATLAEARLVAERDAARGRADSASQSARALGDVGAATAPALGVLRESATRLADLAGGARPGGVDHIVDELHEVERAVASLLGAVALASDPDLALPPGAFATEQPAAGEDWTTTGVFPDEVEALR